MKSLAAELSLPLATLFNSSLQSGVFPTIWKNSYLVPIFKNGSRSQCKNYRGIAILSAIPKLFEQIVHKYLEGELGHFIHKAQHGFRSGCSTTTNLVQFVNFVLEAMPGQVDAIYTDLAFDKVDHKLLLQKLNVMGVGGTLLKWLESYLTNRSLSVRIGAVTSRPIHACSGVPQGSHLGPLLFAIFVNDLCEVFNDCEFLLYADDLKIFRHISSADDTISLQRNLQAVDVWCKRNGMTLNVSKCECISFTRRHQQNTHVHEYRIGDQCLRRVATVKDLGVVLDSGMTFKPHINQVVSRASSMLGFVKRQSKCFSCPYVTKSLYCALVRPLLEYASVVWDPVFSVDNNRLESIQKQFLLFALRDLGWRDRFILPSYKARLQLIDLDTLDERRKVTAACFVASCLDNHVLAPDVVMHFSWELGYQRVTRSASRGPRLHLPPMARTLYVENGPIRRCIEAFNSISYAYSPGLGIKTLKERIRKILMEERRMHL